MIRTKKITAILTVILITALLSVLLISQVDISFATTFDQKIKTAIKHGGTVEAQDKAQWELHKYIDTKIRRSEPFCYCPWIGYLAIARNTEVGVSNNWNCIRIKKEAYESVIDEASDNKATAQAILKEIGAKGTGWSAYRKIHSYMQDSRYITGIKSAKGFFEHKGGDCAAYSSAFYVLCKVQGIPVRWCMGACGTACHAWNRMKIKGKWYWVDETMNFAPKRKPYADRQRPMEMW